ncbi:MAG: Na+/H+ antiporter subunit D, partial [Myxococcales bacterium]|nr:Na+/H+ antiporter subunit D [Myxococcales bacterium]
KALLLMSAGSVLYRTGRRKCTELGGLYHTMPVTMWCGIIGALAISSFPWTSGFVSKSMISTAAAEGHLQLAWMVLTAASAGVFLHAGIKFPWFVFFQKDRGLRPKEVPWNMQAAMIGFAALCVLLGVFYKPLYELLPYSDLALTHYAPEVYSTSHVVSQLQLLLFSGLAFFVLLPLLKRTETITLDADWAYRKAMPFLWHRVLAPPLRVAGMLWDGLRQDTPVAMARMLRITHDDRRLPILNEWTQGAAMLVITVMLFLYLVIGFNLD